MSRRLQSHALPRTAVDSSAASSELRCTLIRSAEGLVALRGTWDALLCESDATVFQSYEWIGTWWKYFGGRGRELWCLVFTLDGEAVGIAPLYLERITWCGVPIARRLRFLGSPQADYNDLLLRRGFEATALEAFADYLCNAPGEWDVLDVDDVPDGSPLASLFPEILRRRGMRVIDLPGTICPEIMLPDTMEKYLRLFGPGTRSGIRRKRTRLHQRHVVQEEVLAHPGDTIEGGVEEFIVLHGKRWKGLGFPSIFDVSPHREFLIDVGKEFARRGWLRIFLLRVDGEVAAASIEFNYRDRIFMYESNAHGSSGVMQCSPGLLIKLKAIEAGIAEGMRVYDLLRGDEPYKRDILKAVDKRNRIIRVTSVGWLRRMLFMFWALGGKVIGRIKLESYEMKRFSRTRHPTSVRKMRYLLGRMLVLLRLGARYLGDYVH